MNWRSPKLLKLVRALPCTFDELEHECEDFDGVVACHSNQIADGKGRAIKAHDYRVAAGCHNANYEIDQGKRLSKVERREYFDAAHRRTIGLLFERGIVVIK